MSGNLDKSLDEILSTRRNTARRGRARRAPNTTRKTAAAPVGGVSKAARNAPKPAGKSSVPSGPSSGHGESKIIVSNLPPDVNELQIKEYFLKSVGAVKRVTITYGPNGSSRGIATIIFAKPGSANDALVKLNGLLVDGRPMKIEVVLDASRAPPPPPERGISDRITRPKVQPKSATAAKPAGGEGQRAGRGGRGGRGGRRGRNAGRPKAKTAEELDAEMTDYFVGNGTEGAATTNGNVAAANGGEDLGMDGVSALALQLDFGIIQEHVPARILRNGAEAPSRTYAKYGVEAPNSLTGRDQHGSESNQPYSYGDSFDDDESLSTIYIGTPPQKLLNFTYGGGSSWHEVVFEDIVTYAGVTYPTQAVGAVEFMSPEYLTDLNFDGYFGLGLDTGNQVKPVTQKTFFTNVAPSLSIPLFTACLNHLNPGVYDFGFIDARKYYRDLYIFLALARPTGQGWWVADSTGYAVGDANNLTSFAGGLEAIIDFGSTFLLMQQQYCDVYYAKAPSVVYDSHYGYILPCKDILPDLTRAIGSYEVKIAGSMLQGVNLNSITCFTGLNPIAIGRDNPPVVYTDIFLKTTFTVFTHSPGGSPSLGFASQPIRSSYVY